MSGLHWQGPLTSKSWRGRRLQDGHLGPCWVHHLPDCELGYSSLSVLWAAQRITTKMSNSLVIIWSWTKVDKQEVWKLYKVGSDSQNIDLPWHLHYFILCILNCSRSTLLACWAFVGVLRRRVQLFMNNSDHMIKASRDWSRQQSTALTCMILTKSFPVNSCIVTIR